jgi:ubiquinone/menaquinone biosynthesis C-methylase UbiE
VIREGDEIMPDHFGHAVMPQANHDEQAMEDHFVGMRTWVSRHMDAIDKRLVNEVVAPEVAARTGRAVRASAEVRKPLEAHPFHQMWLSLNYFYQDRMWKSIDASISRQYDDLAAKIAPLENPKGSLTLDPALEPPRYIGAFDHHRMAGSYHTDTAEGDFRAGALYDRFATTYLRNINGGWRNDGRGHTIASHVKSFYPDLEVDRILDLGCSVGHSTVAIASAFPEAETYAVDIGAPMLRYAHARAESLGQAIRFSQQNAERTNFPDGSFDLVTSSVLLHETSASAMRRIFAECRRLLRPGGVMVHLEVPARQEHLGLWEQVRNDFEAHYNNEPFMAAISRTDFAEVAEAAGFSPADIMVGYRRGTPELKPSKDDFYTQGDPEGRILFGSWYICSARAG